MLVKKEIKANKNCSKAIMETLCYRGVFDYPMSFYQLGTFLITGGRYKKDTLENELGKLLKRRKIRLKNGKYMLNGTSAVNWNKRGTVTKDVLKETDFAFELLGKIPWLRMLSVTGTFAAHNASLDDDIDVFVVTKKGRLWITRFFVTLLLKACGKYRTDASPQGKVCPNIFVDEDNMTWNKKGRTLYVAHEILMMRPLVNKDNTYFKFLKANDWVFTYFGNFPANLHVNFKSKHPESTLVSLVEYLLRTFQLFYMTKKRTNEVTSKGFIHFNRDDHTNNILGKFEDLRSEHVDLRKKKAKRFKGT